MIQPDRVADDFGRKSVARYRPLWVEVEDQAGERLRRVTYIADGKPTDGRLSPRYITLIRDGAWTHALPEPYLRFFDGVQHAE